jgi:hypothetical protein
MVKKTPNYNEKLKVLKSYFKISDQAVKYMYHRRRHGYPWKNNNDPGYIVWTMQIQNALIKADNIALFEWDSLKFDNDIQTLSEHGIIIDDQLKTVQVGKQPLNADIKEEDNDEGWTVVTSTRSHAIKKQLIRSMGFLPQTKKPYIKNTSGKPYVNTEKGKPYVNTEKVKPYVNTVAKDLPII